MTLDQDNPIVRLSDQVKFSDGPGGLPMLTVTSGLARATISVYGGQVLSFQPVDQAHELLFVSEPAFFEQGKAIKGGIPVCWPWFGPDPEGQGRPAHGFVRNRTWTILAAHRHDDGRITITLGVTDNEETRAIWPHRFELNIEITIGSSLEVALVTRNTGDKPFIITQALHAYFNIGDVDRVSVEGLDGCRYLDKTDAGREKAQIGPVIIATEVDRIYTGVTGPLVIDDPALNRRIEVAGSGSRTAVIWNPWAEIAAKMADLGEQEYQRMLCVETANAADEVMTVSAQREVRIGARYRPLT